MRRLEGVRVFLTGHTGFKGAWAVAVLERIGARVSGYALPPPTFPSLFDEAGLAERIDHRIADVLDLGVLRAAMREAQPDVVLHMAARSLVVDGYRDPLATYATNAMGTANVLEAMRTTPSVRAALIVTSDKCYEPDERPRREGDALGGHDPYSASKACAEIVVEGYRPLLDERCVVATARAGNVIGGGDWAQSRLLADLARAMLAGGRIALRRPHAVRPWQHVFDAVCGYVAVVERALAGDSRAGRAWNFGPSRDVALSVRDVVDRFAKAYGAPLEVAVEPSAMPENPSLRLDSTRAREELGWIPLLDSEEAIVSAARWYRRRAEGEPVAALLDEEVDTLLLRRQA